MKNFNIKNLFTVVVILMLASCKAFAESASIEFSINVKPYMEIQTLTNPVLIANITDKTGNLYAPLFSKFRVISNSGETKTLYLKAHTITEHGNESAIFSSNGRVYIAFSSVNNKPTSQSLANLQNGFRFHGNQLNKFGFYREGVAKFDKVTTSVEEAVKDAEIIIVALPAVGHEAFFKELIPHTRVIIILNII